MEREPHRLAEGAVFRCLRACGGLLRSGRYATVAAEQDGSRHVRKRRRFYAPLLVWLGGPLMRMLDTGVRVLPQRDWEERERGLYASLHGASIRLEAGGTLVLPCLPGETLAGLLEDDALDEPLRTRAIELAVAALAAFHARGFTHGDAMAENVLIDLEAGVARWFDFETVHDANRSLAWCRADDVRALLATCLVRTAPGNMARTLRLIVKRYPDEAVTQLLAASFASVWRRPLVYHLGQAGLSFQEFREIGRTLRTGSGDEAPTASG